MMKNPPFEQNYPGAAAKRQTIARISYIVFGIS